MSSDDLGRGGWMTFTIDHDEQDAVTKFQRRYGQPPEHVIEDRRWKVPTLKVGPVPDDEVHDVGNKRP